MPAARARYLAEIADTVRGYKQQRARSRRGSRARSSSCARAARMLHEDEARQGATPPSAALDLAGEREARLDAARAASCSRSGPQMQKAYAGDEYVVKIRDKEIRTALDHTTLSGTKIRKVALPQYEDHGEILQVADARQRAGLASPTPPAPSPSSARARTRRACSPARATPSAPTRRFKLLSEGMPAKRLSTAFDSVTLYGNDPTLRPDIYGKVGNSGVSIATLDDMKVLYVGLRPVQPAHLGVA